jgi:16S rRNA (guanine527-N7)-methyltransferase
MTPAQVCELFGRNGFPLDEARAGALLEYEKLLLEWNGRINLVSRRETSDLFLRQIVGSVAFLFGGRLATGSTLLDVGTGGGLPGIPLAVILPDLRVTVVDSIRKKMTAVSDMAARLGLPNVRAICGRVEELDPEIVGTFDYIVARGVAAAAEIVVWCAPLLARRGPGRSPAGIDAEKGPGEAGVETIARGSYLLLKGGDLTAELAALTETAGAASVIVRALAVAGAEDAFTDKKIVVVTP